MTATEAQTEHRQPAVGFVHTTNFPQLLFELKASLFVTTYQAQRLLTFGSPDGKKMTMWMRTLPRPTGLCVDQKRMAIGSKNQIWTFRSASNIRGEDGSTLPYELIYVPRQSHVTGDIAVHQLTWIEDTLHVLNTRFSCLCTLDPDWSFVPGWTPPFITKVAPEDRCHLNGFCVEDNQFAYATALANTDTVEGWRDQRLTGGVIIDMQSNEILTSGLCMPHSPILHNGHLWVLESGTGSLLTVDRATGTTTEVCRFPGFLRGLSFIGNFAFVGLSKIRERKHFGGVPVEASTTELKCAVYVVNLTTGETVALIEFTKGIEELFDIALLNGIRNPHVVGFEDDMIDSIMVIPPESR